MAKAGIRVSHLLERTEKDPLAKAILDELIQLLDWAAQLGEVKQNTLLPAAFFDRWYGLEHMAILSAATYYLGPVLRRSMVDLLGNPDWNVTKERQRVLHFVLSNSKEDFDPDGACRVLVVWAMQRAQSEKLSIWPSGHEENLMGEVVEYLNSKRTTEIEIKDLQGWYRKDRRSNELKPIGLTIDGQKS